MIRAFLVVGWWCFAVLASAQEKSALGTRSGGGPAPLESASSGFAPLLQMLVAVAIVAVLIRYGVPKLLSKWNRTLSPSLNGGIRVIESAQFAAGMLYLVEARGKTLLLSVSGTQVVCLADLTGAESPAPPTFGEMLKDAAPKAAVLADTVPASDEILRRLDRLTGGLEKS